MARICEGTAMPKTSEQHSLIGSIRRIGKENPERADELRRDLRALSAEKYIQELVDKAPPLTDEQRSRLAALLRPAASDAA